jgi:excisionase family DNA binding protein
MSSGKAHLSVSEAAEDLGISEAFARDLIRGGHLAAYRFGPRKTIVYREDLEAFRRSRRVEASRTSEALEKN